MSDRTTTFSELVSSNLIEIGAGRPRTVNLNGHDLPILRVANVLDGRIESALQAHTSHQDVKGEGSKVSRPGDVVLTTKGTVGRVALMPPDGPAFAYSPQLCYFRPAANGPLRSRFLYYWFKSADFWIQANSLKGQTDMADFLSLGDIQRMRIGVPTLDRQDAVVGVLGALDDKIAINDRIASTCLSLGDALFEQAVRGVAVGPALFGETAGVFGGGTPSTFRPEYWDGGIGWTTPTDVTALSAPYLFRTSRTITDAGLADCASQLYPAGSIFMTSRATIGAFAVPQVATAVNQGFIVVVPPRPELRWWLFHEMRSRVDEMLGLANGSTFPELSRKNFKSMQVRLVAEDVTSSFHTQVGPLHERAAKASQESTTLMQLRDALLPKLMSGEIRVREAEKVLENAL